MQPFMPDRPELVEARHIPYPPQGDNLIFSQSTPPDFTPVDMDPMKTTAWNSDPQPSHHIPVPWGPVDATERLAGNALGIDFLNGDPGFGDFASGPGDDDSGPGWQ